MIKIKRHQQYFANVFRLLLTFNDFENDICAETTLLYKTVLIDLFSHFPKPNNAIDKTHSIFSWRRLRMQDLTQSA